MTDSVQTKNQCITAEVAQSTASPRENLVNVQTTECPNVSTLPIEPHHDNSFLKRSFYKWWFDSYLVPNCLMIVHRTQLLFDFSNYLTDLLWRNELLSPTYSINGLRRKPFKTQRGYLIRFLFFTSFFFFLPTAILSRYFL